MLSFVAVGLGIGAAIVVGRVLASQLSEVSPSDPWSLGAAGLALLAVACIAIYLPARRAARLDPIAALRDE